MRKIADSLQTQQQALKQFLDESGVCVPAEKAENPPRVKRKYTRKKQAEGGAETQVKQKRPYRRRNVSSDVPSPKDNQSDKSEAQRAREAFESDMNDDEASLSSPSAPPPKEEEKILPLELLYPYNVRSRKILEGKNVLGIIVPYIRGKGAFALSLEEVAEMLSLRDALTYARKYPKINGSFWEVLSSLQVQSCEACLKSLNETLKAAGGVPVGGDYLTNPPDYNGTNRQYKVRFAIDVR